jgi:hypothetical protein
MALRHGKMPGAPPPLLCSRWQDWTFKARRFVDRHKVLPLPFETVNRE